ncbi:MAG: SDR family oxidoreductase [SAR202 cluster bacterium]|nr:SDR family oxidoreductase [SAR202 cluster bacterium]MQG39300.1 SDR family oxidoreductase [SAR202 cluster bacterium]|tara:strand:+ start:25201 stop:25962 length:762 start_codon:yes stop_codon:yes gene_type:complete
MDIPTQKVAVITGAGSGIGRETALIFLKNNYKVALAGRNQITLDETIHLSKQYSSNAITVQTDITDQKSITELFEKVKKHFKRLDVLFNNAGIGAPPIPFEELPFEKWQDVVSTNLTGTFLCSQEAIKIMKSQNPSGGRIINNGSISAHSPRLYSAPYTATKHAITGLTKSICLDGRKHKIVCSQIDIGNAGTDMTERMKNGVLQANGNTEIEPTFNVKHVAKSLLHIANLPLDTNVPFITIMASEMPFMGRG